MCGLTSFIAFIHGIVLILALHYICHLSPQFASVDTLLGTMKKLPQQVFMVADLTSEEKKLVAERGSHFCRWCCIILLTVSPFGL